MALSSILTPCKWQSSQGDHFEFMKRVHLASLVFVDWRLRPSPFSSNVKRHFTAPGRTYRPLYGCFPPYMHVKSYHPCKQDINKFNKQNFLKFISIIYYQCSIFGHDKNLFINNLLYVKAFLHSTIVWIEDKFSLSDCRLMKDFVRHSLILISTAEFADCAVSFVMMLIIFFCTQIYNFMVFINYMCVGLYMQYLNWFTKLHIYI